MLEPILKSYLIENITDLNEENVFIGQASEPTTSNTFAVISSSCSPLSDSHNTLAAELTMPKGINERSFAYTITTQGNSYENSANLILNIFAALGEDDGGCIIQNNKKMYITPVEAPFREDGNLFRFNFIVRTSK